MLTVKNKRLFHYQSSIFLGITVILLVLVLYNTHPVFLEKLTSRLHDYKFDVREALYPDRTVDHDAVIVAIDEPSVNQHGRWPWDREVIADLLAKLDQASVVGLDLIFSEPSNENSDNILADAIASNNNIILGYFMRLFSSEDNSQLSFDILSECAYQNFEETSQKIGIRELPYVEVNLESFHDNALSCGFFSIEPDSDGLYRQYPLAYIHNGLILPPLAIQVLRHLYNKDAEIILGKEGVEQFHLNDVLLKDSNYIRLNYMNNVTFVSATDVLTGKVKPEQFKNKVVFIGATETGIFDIRPTPINAVTPGVQIHYTAFNNLLNNNMLRNSTVGDNILIVASVLLSIYLAILTSLRRRLFAYAILAGGILLYTNFVFIGFNFWHQEFFALFALFLTATASEAMIFRRTSIHAMELKNAFSSYVSTELVNQIIDNPDNLQLGGKEKEITVLFCDIRNFTAISEKLSPSELVSMMNRLFDVLTAVVLQNQGMLDKYIGDAMMVLFNAPIDVENHPDKAVDTAIAMLSAIEDINHQLIKEKLGQIDIGIGINTGPAVVGNMGSKVRFGYTAMGDSVNVASRLEALNKLYQSRILISESMISKLNNVGSEYILRRLDKTRVKGKTETLTIYEVLPKNERNQQLKADFESAMDIFYQAKFSEAEEKFIHIHKRFDDFPSKLLAERCNSLIKNPPESDWNGVLVMHRK